MYGGLAVGRNVLEFIYKNKMKGLTTKSSPVYQ